MLQINDTSKSRFKIKSIRKIEKVEEPLQGAVCSLDPDDGSGKPPC